jgi:hypothetical protein
MKQVREMRNLGRPEPIHLALFQSPGGYLPAGVTSLNKFREEPA